MQPEITCTDIYGNEGGDWTGDLAGYLGVNGNISMDPLFCDPEAGVLTLRADSPCAPLHDPECGRIGAWPVGCYAPEDVAAAEAGGPRASAAPNPFTRETRISYDIPGSLVVTASILVYDPAGRLIRSLAMTASGAGEVVWDGCDDAGARVTDGIYFCKIGREGATRGSTLRLVLLR